MTRTALWGDTIALHYSLSAGDGTEVMNTFADDPVTIKLGEGEIEAKLESCLIDLEVGRRYVFNLEPEQAFGLSNPEQVMDVPLDAFDDLELEIGSLVEFALPDGETLAGQIKSANKDFATVDFNHPLSGCAVVFEVKIMDILEP
ncbi:peptidyl-prolyl cis-trans isomerase [Sulfurimicrobium lacus]|uniref:Peptidyl-prolyl cis-trans isomerase n=1 Tax=Sulfurimicrobium lacus TaxID=2715678 RepID=A0A6F8VAP3_9PROT|nr:FKBP-type peptidyl-prolyl cis-trans isomerase [Sulfurimicrobium lacus]BCB25819.1 peptidyl-prolyl cis-trans isomerase [Sulfurimicrobium lacus]